VSETTLTPAMRPEERLIWFLRELIGLFGSFIGLFDTDAGHLLLLCAGIALSVHFYPAGIAAIGSALFMKIRQQAKG